MTYYATALQTIPGRDAPAPQQGLSRLEWLRRYLMERIEFSYSETWKAHARELQALEGKS